MITTIIFDLAEVYLHGLPGVEPRLEKILKIDSKKIWAALREEDLFTLFNGKITEDEYWSRVIKKNGWNVDVDTIKRTLRENFKEIEGTRGIIEELKNKGFRLGLLSVHAKEWIDFCLGKFDYHKLFDSVSYSFEVGVSKPDKRAYKIILGKLKAKPEECLYIDDTAKNLIPAKELGMKTVLFTTSKQLKKDLAKFGIVV